MAVWYNWESFLRGGVLLFMFIYLAPYIAIMLVFAVIIIIAVKIIIKKSKKKKS